MLASAARATDDGQVLGDPIEAALLLAAMERGLSLPELSPRREVVHEIPFDSDRKLMTLVYDGPDDRTAFTKGAPEVVFERAGSRSLRSSISPGPGPRRASGCSP